MGVDSVMAVDLDMAAMGAVSDQRLKIVLQTINSRIFAKLLKNYLLGYGRGYGGYGYGGYGKFFMWKKYFPGKFIIILIYKKEEATDTDVIIIITAADIGDNSTRASMHFNDFVINSAK